MWRAIVFSVGLVCGAAFAAQGDAYAPSPHAIDVPAWFTESFLDFREDIPDAAKQGKRLMVYFGQDGCPYCKALMKVNFGNAQIVAMTRRHFVAIALNIWGDREVTWIDGRRMTEKALATTLRVQYTPTLLFFDEEGRIALRLNGYVPPERFRIALDYVAGRLEKQQPYTAYLAARTGAGAAPVAGGVADLAGELKRGGKPLAVRFSQAGCAECEEMRKAFERDDVKGLAERFSVVEIDLAGARPVVTPSGERTTEGAWARKLGLTYVPSLVFFAADGREAFRAEGYLRAFHLASALDYVGSGAFREEPSFQRYIQKRADAQRARGGSVDLWK